MLLQRHIILVGKNSIRQYQIILILGQIQFIMTSRRSSRHPITSNLAHIHPRNNPTNTHTNIFGWKPQKTNVNSSVRCTPTFHSHIFNTQAHSTLREKPNFNQTVLYSNKTKDQKQAELRHGTLKVGQHARGIQDFYDVEKLHLMKDLEQNNIIAKQRKLLEMSSSPIHDNSQIQSYKLTNTASGLYIPPCYCK